MIKQGKNITQKNYSKVTIALIVVSVVLLCMAFGVGYGFAFASGSQNSDKFGLGTEQADINTSVGVIMPGDDSGANSSLAPNDALASSTERDISASVKEILYRKEEAAKAAAAAQKIDDANHIAKAKANIKAQVDSGVGMPNLPEINWDQGKAGFMAEWTSKINKYYKGTPLEGHGEKFASMAWELGIDPRWSPAISNTESSKGLYCFAEHNAWGWGDGGWKSWDEAIEAHITGLSKGYGYTISKPYAQKYCPPNHENWYNNTLSEMTKLQNIQP